MPNTSVSPAAMRKSMTPSCSPFRHCSSHEQGGHRRELGGVPAAVKRKGRGRAAPLRVRAPAGRAHHFILHAWEYESWWFSNTVFTIFVVYSPSSAFTTWSR